MALPIYASIAACAALLLGVLYSLSSAPQSHLPDYLPVDIHITSPEAAVERFAGMLRFETVSKYEADNHAVKPDEFKALHSYMRQQWPQVFAALEVQEVSELSLLFKWPGSDPALKPVLCVSHLDVVAVGPPERWTHPPFSGKLADGFVWGRGALDVKVTAAALLEAVSHLLQLGFKPRRTIYLAFGHDEEVLGTFGAGAMARLLQEAGVQLAYIFDEGGTVLIDGVRGLTTTPVALVGTAEKAYQNFEVEVHGNGGHTMSPPHDASSAMSRLARIIQKLDATLPPPRLREPSASLVRGIGSVADSRLVGILLRNSQRWPLSTLLSYVISRSDGDLSACVRTTGVLTDIELLPQGKNVIPSLARAHFNFRLLPDEDPNYAQQLLERLARAESKGGEVRVIPKDSVPQSAVSSAGDPGFRAIQQAALETIKGPEGLVVTPYLMLGRTDSTQYAEISGGNVFRFMPFPLNRTAGDVQRVHGIDERVGQEAYLQGVKFYIRFLQLA